MAENEVMPIKDLDNAQVSGTRKFMRLTMAVNAEF